MINVCAKCGQYCVEKEIDPSGPYAICPYCGHRHPFRQLPLFVLTGASAAGKSTVNVMLPVVMSECVFIESDILWTPAFVDPDDDDYRDYWNTWLRVAKNISQGGRPVVVCGSARPEQLESCPERRYFADIHYMALVCEPHELRRRLKRRPSWRHSSDTTFIEQMVQFNGWFKQNAAQTTPPMRLLDTTHLSVKESVREVMRWIRPRLTTRPSHSPAFAEGLPTEGR